LCAIFRTVSGENKEKENTVPQTFASADAKHLNRFYLRRVRGEKLCTKARVEPVRREAQRRFLKKEVAPLF